MCRWRIIADLHDTSTAMIEKSYSANIAHHADEVARRGLVDFDQTPWKIDRTSTDEYGLPAPWTAKLFLEARFSMSTAPTSTSCIRSNGGRVRPKIKEDRVVLDSCCSGLNFRLAARMLFSVWQRFGRQLAVSW
jgi:hypothetical protein